ncbi:AAA family ATPase [Streptomyces sp. NBC_01352]|uniref:AAA family ATPase n=1 Tax=Streptomyces sp. NBC_01352 TaxID=2903834 RepID=UPI002E322379|nr:AAA family ATPase [Streptomyces sp. NBC_01352]
MNWNTYYRGTGTAAGDVRLPPPPPWRTFPRASAAEVFHPPEGLVDAVNAALCLRRPLLITGPPGSGKSTVIEQVAAELGLGQVLRWHITSRSTLADALYRYDALGRIHAQRLQHELARARPEAVQVVDDVAEFLRLGPLGTALLPSSRPRALLIDEIDKADLDLPGDLLDVLERGEYRIAELQREGRDIAEISGWDGEGGYRVEKGRVQCTEFPFIVMTSNEEQELPSPFLRRCVRYEMPPPTVELLGEVVRAHLGMDGESEPAKTLIDSFVTRVGAGERVAVDQLLGTLHILRGVPEANVGERKRLEKLLMKALGSA